MSTIHIRIDAEQKIELIKFSKQLGLDVSSLTKMYYQHILINKKLPFVPGQRDTEVPDFTTAVLMEKSMEKFDQDDPLLDSYQSIK